MHWKLTQHLDFYFFYLNYSEGHLHLIITRKLRHREAVIYSQLMGVLDFRTSGSKTNMTMVPVLCLALRLCTVAVTNQVQVLLACTAKVYSSLRVFVFVML